LTCAAFLWATAAAAQPIFLEVIATEVGYDRHTGRPLVTVTFSEATRVAFNRLTTENVGRYVEMRMDGKPIMKVAIREPILGARGQLTADSSEKAQAMAEHLSKPGARIEVELVPGP
jgi:preprotein translocase subunit SecD